MAWAVVYLTERWCCGKRHSIFGQTGGITPHHTITQLATLKHFT